VKLRLFCCFLLGALPVCAAPKPTFGGSKEDVIRRDTAVPQTGEPGAVKATTRILPDGSRATNIVDPDKREAVETVTDAAGKVLRKTLFTLDERDLTTGCIHYDAKNNVRYKEAYKRDAADRIAETYLYSAADKLLGRRVFNYDGRGNITQVDDYDSFGKLIMKPSTPSPGRGSRRR
jgi:hypothetical protein